MTPRQFAELVQRSLAAGTPSDDYEPKIDEIRLWIGPAIAYAAKAAYSDSVNVDGIEYIGDAFYTTFKNLSLVKDDETGFYTAELAAMPYGLRAGYDINAIYLQGAGKLSQGLIRVENNHKPFYQRLDLPPNKVFYWLEGKLLTVNSAMVLDGYKVRLTMASGAGIDPDKDMPCPEEYIPSMTDFVKKQFMEIRLPVKDVNNDGNNMR